MSTLVSGDRWAGRSAMCTHHLERFCPRHAGEAARESDNASQNRPVNLGSHCVPQSASAGPTHLSSCLLFSRSASARTRCWCLLLLRIDTGTKCFHQIDHARRGSFPRGFDLLASLFLLQKSDEGVFVAVLELRRVEVTRLRLHDVRGQIEHLLLEF